MGVFSSFLSPAAQEIRAWVGEESEPRRRANFSSLDEKQLQLVVEMTQDPKGYQEQQRKLMRLVEKSTQWLEEARQRGDSEEIRAAKEVWQQAVDEFYRQVDAEIALFRALGEERRLPGSGLEY